MKYLRDLQFKAPRTTPVNPSHNRKLRLMARSRDSEKAQVNGRLTEHDWLRAGFELLAESGIGALKLDRLCERLRVTKGSFYWHFDSMAGYRRRLVAAWGDLRDEDRRDVDRLGTLPPRQRLARMMAILTSPRHWTLERAMREWARTDPAVAASVRAADRRVLEAVRRAFLDHGFDAEEAGLRADATFAAGVGFLHLSGERPGPAAAPRWERFLDLMLRP